MKLDFILISVNFKMPLPTAVSVVERGPKTSFDVSFQFNCNFRDTVIVFHM